MKRYIALLLVSLILSATCIYIQRDATYVIANDLEEITADTPFSTDDGSNEKKSSTWMLALFPMIIVLTKIVEKGTSNLNVRRSFLTAVFYQSNNVVITPLLK